MGKTRSKQQMCLEGAFSDNANEQFSESILNIQVVKISFEYKKSVQYNESEFSH